MAYIQAVKHVIIRLLVLHEQLKILKYLEEAKHMNTEAAFAHSDTLQ